MIQRFRITSPAAPCPPVRRSRVRRHFRGRAVPSILGLALVASLHGKPEVTSHWTTRDGLPSNGITAMTRTPDGYLWIGTDDGLCRFDGVRFVTFGPENGVPRGHINDLDADAEGRLWITDAERNKHLLQKSVATPAPIPAGDSLLEGNDGKVYALSPAGLRSLPGGGISSPPFPATCLTRPPFQTLVTRSGRVGILAYEAGFLTLEQGAWKRQTDYQSSRLFVGALAEDADGDLLVALETDRIWKMSATGRTELPVGGQNLASFRSLLRCGEDLWAVNLRGGLWRFDEGAFRPYPLGDGQLAVDVSSLVADSNQDLWIGTADNGLYKVSRAAVETRRIRAAGGAGKVTALLESSPGRFIVGTDGYGTFVWQDGSASPLAAEDSAFQTYVYSNVALKTGSDAFWLGTGNGLHEFKDGARLTDAAFASRFGGGDSVFALCADPDGSIWVGCASGRLYRLRGRTLEDFRLSPPSSIPCLVMMPDGTLVGGTDNNGLWQLRQGQSQRLGSATDLVSPNVRALHVDRRGRLWVGTLGGGLSVLQGDRLVPVPLDRHESVGAIHQIIDDGEGWLWLGTTHGILGIEEARVDACLSGGSGERVHPVRLGTAEGMLSEQCTRMKPLQASDGRLYFGTMHGFVGFSPAAMRPQFELPEALIEEIAIDGRTRYSQPPGSRVSIPPDSRFELHFTALGQRNPESIRFRYRLAGLENQWIESPDRRFASYTHLPPGDYRFLVQAGTESGQWSPASGIVEFKVEPHYWQTAWFAIGLGVTALTAAGWLVLSLERRRVGRQRIAVEREQAINSERMRIARDLHDGIGADLTHASMLAGTLRGQLARPEHFQERTQELSERLKSLTRDLSTAVWMTSPRHDRLSSLATYLGDFMTEFFRRSPIRCRFDIDPQLPDMPIAPQVRHHLFMVMKEAMNNALKHSEATEVHLDIAREADSVRISFSDDGKGIHPPEGGAARRRNGLHHMSERIREIGGDFRIESPGSAGSPRKGTRVEIRIPLGLQG